MNATEFAATYGGYAQLAAESTNLNRWVVLTQWAFETGLAAPNSGVGINNLAGIRNPAYPLNAEGFSIYPDLAEFVKDYSRVLHQGNMAGILEAGGDPIPEQFAAFARGQWVGTDPAANAAYAAHLASMYVADFSNLAGTPSPPQPGPVVSPPSSESGGLDVADRDFLYGQLVKLGHAVGFAIDTPPWAPPGVRTYTVKPGDSLSAIAASYYADANDWPLIYEANKALIGADPNLIHPGQVLVLPDKSQDVT